MSKHEKTLKVIKKLGFIYFIANLVLFLVLMVLCFYTTKKYQQFSSEWMLLLLPGVGMLSGYWIRTSQYGWIRSFVIAVSFVCSAVLLFIAFVTGPQLDQLKAEKFKEMHVEQQNQFDESTDRLFLGVYRGDIEIVKQQLDKGVDVNAINETKGTALHVTQDADIARLLLKYGANIHAKNDLGTTPIFNKEIEIAEILLDAGVDIDSRSEKGNTLLMYYTYSGYLDGIKFLVERGADVNSCNSDKQNALDIAEHFQPNTATLGYLQNLHLKTCQ